MTKEKKEHTENTSMILGGERNEKIGFLGKEFTILKNVFSPKIFPSTRWFAKELKKIIRDNKVIFLEMGCGSGMISIFLGMKNKNVKITAVDVNPDAVENTKLNIKNYNLESKIIVKESDVFENLKGENFDIIFWAMPFGYLDKEKEITDLEKSVFDPGYEHIERFISESKNHLSENGRLLIGFSKDIGDFELLEKICKENNLKIKLISETEISEGNNKVGMEIYELISR